MYVSIRRIFLKVVPNFSGPDCWSLCDWVRRILYKRENVSLYFLDRDNSKITRLQTRLRHKLWLIQVQSTIDISVRHRPTPLDLHLDETNLFMNLARTSIGSPRRYRSVSFPTSATVGYLIASEACTSPWAICWIVSLLWYVCMFYYRAMHWCINLEMVPNFSGKDGLVILRC